ncbi:MAG: ubiquinol-cytochrome c reductase iron-sulfur subunit [Ignavibacteria bacterium]
MKNENVNRRDFLKTSFKTIAIGSIALSAIDVKKLLAESTEVSEVTKVINLGDYPALSSVGGSVQIGKVYVSRTGQSKFLALSMICTHKKCDVDATGDGFECPCHGSAFSKTGKVINGPATKNLKSFKTTYNAEKDTLTF